MDINLDRDGKKGKEGMGVKKVVSYQLISLDNDDDDGVAEVDRFLTEVDEEKAQVDRFLTKVDEEKAQGSSSSMAGPVQHEARKKQKLYGGPVEPSLLDSPLEMCEGACFTPGLVPCPQQPQDKSDIQFGVTNKPLDQDPPYDPAVYELFHNRDNVWVQRANRITALEMWDDAYDYDYDGDDYYSTESEYDPY
ncbi:hypothetical protein ACHAQJ_002115 [Trichoderma viride]